MKKDFTKQDFFDLLKPNGDCLEWHGWCDRDGYGRTSTADGMKATHRLALQLEGVDLIGKVVMHSCDNPCCCNPAHLSAGTQAQNVADMVSKSRQSKRKPPKKLTEEQVIEIRKLYENKTITQTALAKQFNVSQVLIGLIVNRKSWSHI